MNGLPQQGSVPGLIVMTTKTVSLAPCSSVTTRSEEHTSELQSRPHLVCRLLLEKKKKKTHTTSLRPGNRFTRPATCAKQHRQIGACRLLPDRGQKGCRTDVSFLSHSRTTHTFNP